MTNDDRAARAAQRRERMTLHPTTLEPDEPDRDSVFGLEAVALVEALSRESWALTGRPMPRYERHRIPCRFVPWPKAS